MDVNFNKRTIQEYSGISTDIDWDILSNIAKQVANELVDKRDAIVLSELGKRGCTLDVLRQSDCSINEFTEDGYTYQIYVVNGLPVLHIRFRADVNTDDGYYTVTETMEILN